MSRLKPPVSDESEIVFEEGIIGVPRARRFQLLERPGSPLRILRCLDINGLALPVIDPYRAMPDYRPQFNRRVWEALGFGEGDPVLVLAITSIEPGGGVANLRAPVVINVRERRGTQVILDGNDYPVRAPVTLGEEIVTAHG